MSLFHVVQYLIFDLALLICDKKYQNYRKCDIFFNFHLTENMFLSIVKNQENMIFML